MFSNSHLLLLAYTDNHHFSERSLLMKFTDEQKKAIVARYENGGSIRLICSEFNIPRSTLYRWCKTYKVDIIANGTPFTAREINQMQNRIVKLNNIIAILKTANCTVSAPLRERLAALESLYNQYDVYTLCEALEVDRGTFLQSYPQKQTRERLVCKAA